MDNKKKLFISVGAFVITLGVLFFPVEGQAPAASSPSAKAPAMDLSTFSSARPESDLDLLFIHHSVGGQWLTQPGPDNEIALSIHSSHPNAGGLKRKLTEQGYKVHEASYGSDIGDKTDMFDWLPKYQNKMDKVLRTAFNDELLPDGSLNQIVVFKSCYPNNRFVGEGSAPGNPHGPELTVWNAKATLTALLPEFAKQNGTLFVYVTAPANVYKPSQTPLWKWVAKKLLSKPMDTEIAQRQADLAREFNNWVKSSDGWLKDYAKNNVVVFDYYDILTNNGASNFSLNGSEGNTDNHPSRAGNEKASAEFVPFLNRAVRRAGLSK